MTIDLRFAAFSAAQGLPGTDGMSAQDPRGKVPPGTNERESRVSVQPKADDQHSQSNLRHERVAQGRKKNQDVSNSYCVLCSSLAA